VLARADPAARREDEARLDQGEHLLDLSPARQVTLGECLERYAREFTVHKRGRVAEAARVRMWRRHPLAARALGSIRQHDLAEWRDAMIAAGRSPRHIKNVPADACPASKRPEGLLQPDHLAMEPTDLPVGMVEVDAGHGDPPPTGHHC
jgi:hypothetical protein